MTIIVPYQFQIDKRTRPVSLRHRAVRGRGAWVRRGRGAPRPHAHAMTDDIAPEHHLSCYKLKGLIGSGAFGQVHLGTHQKTGTQVAIKLEPLSAAHPQLPHEARLYKSLSGDGVCKMYWHGSTDDGNYALILDLLGCAPPASWGVCGGAGVGAVAAQGARVWGHRATAPCSDPLRAWRRAHFVFCGLPSTGRALRSSSTSASRPSRSRRSRSWR